VIDAAAFTFIHEVNADGVSHRYRAIDVPELDDRWALMLGDCAINLRGSLDYLARELIRANGGHDDDHIAFPVCRSAHDDGLIGIADDAMQLIEEVQPDADSAESERIHAIDALAGAARARLLSLSPAATGHRVPVKGVNPAPPIIEVWTSDRPLEPGKTVHGYTYGEPYFGSDPSVEVYPHLVVDEPAVAANFGRVAASVLFGDKLIPWLREQFLPRFEPFF
jgi:hypothetical protein